MSGLSPSETHLKTLVKAALIEIFQERRDLFQELIAGALEDLTLIKAIDETKAAETISQYSIFSILEQSESRQH